MTDTRKIYNSPVGEFLYPRLVQPDTAFDEEGVYHVKLVLEGERAEALIAFIDGVWDDHIAQVRAEKRPKKVKEANRPYAPEVLTDDDGNETDTGRTLFNFKVSARGHNPTTDETWDNSVKITDALDNVITGEARNELRIGSGTRGRIGFKFNCYPKAGKPVPAVGAGVGLRLTGVKIYKLVEWTAQAEMIDGDDSEETGSFVFTGASSSRTKKDEAFGADHDSTETTPKADDTDEDF